MCPDDVVPRAAVRTQCAPGPQDHQQRLTAAFDAAGIKEWEMYRVSNQSGGSGDPPLELPLIARTPGVSAVAWA